VTYKKTLLIGKHNNAGGRAVHDVELDLELRPKEGGTELSICGSVWMANRRDIIAGGQLDPFEYVGGGKGTLTVSKRRLERIKEIWDRWHLNGMKSGCQHQRAEGWGKEELVMVTYRLNSDTLKVQNRINKIAQDRLIAGEVVQLLPEEVSIVTLSWEIKVSADQAPIVERLAAHYKEHSREKKLSTWVYEHEHPKGCLSKPCPVCGYKYGSAWLHETLPAEIEAEIKELFEGKQD